MIPQIVNLLRLSNRIRIPIGHFIPGFFNEKWKGFMAAGSPEAPTFL